MNRRAFISLVGSAAAAWPLAAHAQQTTWPVVGFLGSTSSEPWRPYVAAFGAGLAEKGYVDGRNVTIEFRWAEGKYESLPAMAAELARHKVAVLVSTGGEASVRAAMAATTTIPIVFTVGEDPVKLGLVASLNRPGGHVTGVNIFTAAIQAKRLGLLRDMVPTATLVAALVNPSNPPSANQTKEIQEAARAVGLNIRILHATTEHELDEAFASLAQLHAGALLVASDPFFNSRRDYVVALAARHAIPAIYEQSVFAAAGGLISYGTDVRAAYHQVGVYTGRILNGEKPPDLPVVQASKFELVINLKTAKTLGLIVPPGLSAQADEVIE
jgi:putative ABC transport system substrate-binding protein